MKWKVGISIFACGICLGFSQSHLGATFQIGDPNYKGNMLVDLSKMDADVGYYGGEQVSIAIAVRDHLNMAMNACVTLSTRPAWQVYEYGDLTGNPTSFDSIIRDTYGNVLNDDDYSGGSGRYARVRIWLGDMSPSHFPLVLNVGAYSSAWNSGSFVIDVQSSGPMSESQCDDGRAFATYDGENLNIVP